MARETIRAVEGERGWVLLNQLRKGRDYGGMALQWLDWGVLGISLGLLGIEAAAVYALLAVDPTQAGLTATDPATR